mgnify:CR=1 FL=1
MTLKLLPPSAKGKPTPKRRSRHLSAALKLPNVRIRGRENSHVLSLLRIDWPVANSVIEKLNAFLAVSAKANGGENRVREIVEKALQAYSRVLYHDRNQKYPDPLRISVFLNAVITDTCRYLNVELADDAGRRWSADSKQTLAQFQSERHSPVNMVWETNDADLRRALYELLTCDQLKTVLRESNNEKAILDGRLALGY